MILCALCKKLLNRELTIKNYIKCRLNFCPKEKEEINAKIWVVHLIGAFNLLLQCVRKTKMDENRTHLNPQVAHFVDKQFVYA